MDQRLQRRRRACVQLAKVTRDEDRAASTAFLRRNAEPALFLLVWQRHPKSAAVADWQRACRKLFKLANIQHPVKTPKRCFTHMFCHTFAVENLLAGVSLDQVSLLLGLSSTKTTEKHYSSFVRARQDQLVSAVKHALNQNGDHTGRRYEPVAGRMRLLEVKAVDSGYLKHSC